MNEWAGEPSPPGRMLMFADLEEEFDVRIYRMTGHGSWWMCTLPGTKLWVAGQNPADLREELIRHKWVTDATAQRGALNEGSNSGPGGARTP